MKPLYISLYKKKEERFLDQDSNEIHRWFYVNDYIKCLILNKILQLFRNVSLFKFLNISAGETIQTQVLK